MAYHTSIYLFLFLPAVLLVYQLIPKKGRPFVLLGFSYLFFFIISQQLILYILSTTVWIYGVGNWLDRVKQQGKQKLEATEDTQKSALKCALKNRSKFIVVIGITALLLVLGYLKYYNFLGQALYQLVNPADAAGFQLKKMAVPIGISFYTLSAIGYLLDVYWGKVHAEKNLGKLALFLSFFPVVMEGPICRYQDTSDQLMKGEPLCSENLLHGILRIFWGLFKKMIIADRLYVIVYRLFHNYLEYHGVMIVVAAMSYTIQLYMEFSGCMDIVIGSGQLFGVRLPENFRQPFMSRNAAEFWRRWHISLGVWFKSYVFYPVSVSRPVKKWNNFARKKIGKQVAKVGVSAMALFPVWFFNGLWHGARWSYLFYGMYYFTLLLLAVAVEPLRKKILTVCKINENAPYWIVVQLVKTWMIIFTGELFFRADGFRIGVSMFGSMFHDFHLQSLWDGTLLHIGLEVADYVAIGIGLIIVLIVGLLKEKHDSVIALIQKMSLPARWAIYYSLILSVVIFGAYGTGYQAVDLIYAGF